MPQIIMPKEFILRNDGLVLVTPEEMQLLGWTPGVPIKHILNLEEKTLTIVAFRDLPLATDKTDGKQKVQT